MYPVPRSSLIKGYLSISLRPNSSHRALPGLGPNLATSRVTNVRTMSLRLLSSRTPASMQSWVSCLQYFRYVNLVRRGCRHTGYRTIPPWNRWNSVKEVMLDQGRETGVLNLMQVKPKEHRCQPREHKSYNCIKRCIKWAVGSQGRFNCFVVKCNSIAVKAYCKMQNGLILWTDLNWKYALIPCQNDHFAHWHCPRTWTLPATITQS